MWINHRPGATNGRHSLREGAGNGLCHSSCRPETGTLRAIFIAPTKLRRIWGLPLNVPPETPIFYTSPFIGRHSLSLAFARQLPQRGSRETLPFIGVLAEIRGYGRFSSPLRKGGCHSSYHPEIGVLLVPFIVFNQRNGRGMAAAHWGGYCSTSNLYPTPQTVFRFHLGLTPSSFSRRRFTWTSTVRESPK